MTLRILIPFTIGLITFAIAINAENGLLGAASGLLMGTALSNK